MSAAKTHSPAAEPQPARPITSQSEAQELFQHLANVMDRLLGIVEQETALVRAGKLAEAAELKESKLEFSQMYIADTARIKASQPHLERVASSMVADLRKRHELFRALLQVNLTVLATAHAVSESIMRNVSHELARKATPQGYGASGQSAAPSAASHQPLTVSRVL
jgi:hypothetical protein